MILFPLTAASFVIPSMTSNPSQRLPNPTSLFGIGLYYGTSTGNTEEVADQIVEAFNKVKGDGFCVSNVIDDVTGSLGDEFAKHDAIIVGTPTWNTGAEIERSGTAWDDVYYGEISDLSLDGKPVAVFGLGDQSSYGANYADASGELFDVFEGKGCNMVGMTDVDNTYEHEESKAQRGDKFVGLLLDQMNQDDLTPDRVGKWVNMLVEAGFGSGGSVSSPSPAAAAPATEQILDDSSSPSSPPVVSVPAEVGSGAWRSYYNPDKKSTMWVSPDGREAIYSQD